MKDIFENIINWDAIGRPKSELNYAIERAAVVKETAALSVEIRANFIIPGKDLQKIKRHILTQIDGLRDVIFNITYEGLAPEQLQAKGERLNNQEISITDASGSDSGKAKTIGKSEDAENAGIAETAKMAETAKAADALTIKYSGKPKREPEEERQQNNIDDAKKALQDEKKKRLAEGNADTERRKTKGGTGNNTIFGKAISKNGIPTPLKDLSEDKTVIVEGQIFSITEKDVFDKEKKKLISLLITDNENSACIKVLLDQKTWKKLENVLVAGTDIRAAGITAMDFYDHEIIIRSKSIEKLPHKHREDLGEEKRVELHAHTKMSALDAVAEVSELIKLAAGFGHKAVAITDHGVVQAFPEAAKVGDKAGIKVIFGLEGYLFDNGEDDGSDRKQYKMGATNHIILLAKNQEGLKNLYKIVSFSHIDYFYKKPRIPKSLLIEYREGLLIGSACVAGQVYQAVKNEVSEKELLRISSLYDYLEIQPLANNAYLVDKGEVADKNELMDINRRIVELGRRLGKPVAATCDVHYLEKYEAKFRNVLLAGQGYKDLEGEKGLYFRTTDEMLEEFAYLGEETAKAVVVDAPCLIADMVEAVRPVPKGKFPPKIENSHEVLRNTCMETAWNIYGNPLPGPVASRLERELNSIISNDYAVMYVSAQRLVKKSLEDGYLVGSRGSVGSSFAATMAGITEVNPLPPHYICPNPDCRCLKWGDPELYSCGADMPPLTCPDCGNRFRQDGFNIPFETFLGFEGDKEPDIDLNFAGEYQPFAHKYVEEMFGQENVFRAGTISTIKNKTALGFVRKYHEELGIPLNKWEAERLTQACTDVRRTTGQHPGGIIIVPEGHEIYEFCPVQHPANDAGSGVVTTHFEYHSIDENLLKLDILGHDVPSMIRHLQDLTGVDPLSVPLNDEKVNSIFNGIEGLAIKEKRYAFKHGSYGIPEFGTRFVRQMLDVTSPRNLSDLIRISGFSHGTDVWSNNAHDLIKSGTAALDEAISTRDDIMNYLIGMGVPNIDSFKIMEKVRKGKGVSEDEADLMRAHNVPDWYVESCRRIKYMFPKAHAVAYVMMSYRIAYYKVYYPEAFYAVYFTASSDNFDAETALSGMKAVLDRIKLVDAKGKNATNKEQDEAIVLEVLYEMFARGFELLPPDVGVSDSARFVVENGKLRIPLAALQGVGVNAARSIKEAFDESPFISVDDLRVRAKVNKTALDALTGCGALDALPASNQISFLEGLF